MWLNLWIIFTLDCFLLPYFISNKSLLLPCVFLVPLKNLLINSFDSYQVFVLEDKPFLYGTLCHCEKCREFGLFVRTLLFWEFAISFLLLCFICLNEINLWACLLYSSFMLNDLYLVHLLNFVEQIFCDLLLWYNLDNKFILITPLCLRELIWCFVQCVSFLDL